MNKINKKTISVFSLLLFGALNLAAQQNHFIYLQTANKQPFYIKLNKKLLSSSASGYLIIPKLQEGNYQLVIGFPKNEWPEQNVTCTINKKDVGYLLKDFGEKGWGLFDFQTMEVVMSGIKATENKTIASEEKKDIVSSSANNASPEKKTEDIPATKEDIKPAVAAEKNEEALKNRSQITKWLNNTNADGMELGYIDWVNEHPDTIRVFIPADKSNETVKTEKNKEELAIEVPQKLPVQNSDPKFIDIELPNPNSKIDTVLKQAIPLDNNEKKVVVVKTVEMPKENISKTVMINSDCKNFATEDDFLKLRKKMAAEDNDDDMVDVAKKLFKSRCFTTEQVKNLSFLFLKDAGKYKFFDVAYAFVSDSYNFSSLETQLTDTYFISRFKVMMRH
jgi:Domain of unknown function (DUF4476)